MRLLHPDRGTLWRAEFDALTGGDVLKPVEFHMAFAFEAFEFDTIAWVQRKRVWFPPLGWPEHSFELCAAHLVKEGQRVASNTHDSAAIKRGGRTRG